MAGRIPTYNSVRRVGEETHWTADLSWSATPGIDLLQVPPISNTLKPVPDLFVSVAEKAQTFLEALSEDDNVDALEYLRCCYSQLRCPPIDYDRYAQPFAYFYFLENYWKAVFTFIKAPSGVPRRILDVGSGSGAMTLAYLAALEWQLTTSVHGFYSQEDEHQQWPVTVILLDRSAEQLKLAGELFERVRDEFRHLSVTLHKHCEDLTTWQPMESGVDIILMGHVLTENQVYAKSILNKVWECVSPNGSIYLIERHPQRDTVWSAIEKNLPYPHSLLHLKYGEVNEDIQKLVAWHPALREKHTRITTRYLQIQAPECKRLVRLLFLYFYAWQTQSVDVLDELFCELAEYHDKPPRAPVEGLPSIKEYWVRNVLTQRDIRLQVLATEYGREQVFAEWEAIFKQNSQHVRLNGMLRLVLDEERMKVKQLHECYRSIKSPGDSSWQRSK